jgi:dinuclear metal center YbgI/SA1388 family protein
MPIPLSSIVAHLDDLLRAREIPDYAGALNGLQLESRGDVRAVAAAVDFSRRTVQGAIDAGANLLLVHHGMFWGGNQRIVGAFYERISLALEHDLAVYASHLPLDAHATLGNNVLLARALGLEPSGAFARYQTTAIGVTGESEIATATLAERADAFARERGGAAVVTPHAPERRTRHWGICTGAGASSETIREAEALGLDTLVVGEGPHHTAVEAPEHGLVIIYAGHYATETLGVRALAEHVARTFDVPWTFVDAPTGL